MTDSRVVPFDQRQRYEVLAALVRACPDAAPVGVLDVGGYYQELDGRALVPAREALPSARTIAVDRDGPSGRDAGSLRGFARADGRRLPFSDAQFDIVSCMDVLEHVPREARQPIVAELLRVARRYVAIAVPVADHGAAEREAALASFIGAHLGGDHQQIAEHRAFGLPRHAEMEGLLPAGARSFGYGNLDRWFLLMVAKHYALGLPHNLDLFHALDAAATAADAETERHPPFYRRFYLAPARPGVSHDPLDRVAEAYRELDGPAGSRADALVARIFLTIAAADPGRLAAARAPFEARVAALEREAGELRRAVSEVRGVLRDVEASAVYRLYRWLRPDRGARERGA